LLRFFQQQLKNSLARLSLAASMVLCSAAALGSQSRGALLAMSAMVITLWWRGTNKLRMGFLLVIAALPLIEFMPQEWADRMSTINNYEEDRSAMGRISAWWTAWRIALRYPLGVGFDQVRPELFARFSPYPDFIHAAHSIYFQVLGNHGFVGLFLFLGIWWSTWRIAEGLRTQTVPDPQAQWTADLGAMCQVSLVGYAVGGAFLSLAYFDLPYNLLVVVVLTKAWVEHKAWQTEPTAAQGWKTPALWRTSESGRGA
jgi:putative inorganic carbon (HCO3(-)) transporter